MDMFLFIDKDTFLHNLDPRTKIFVMFISFIVILMINNLYALIALAFLVFSYGFFGQVLYNLKKIKVILFMIFFLSIVLWSLTYKGETHIFGPFYLEGLILGLEKGIKFNLLIISGMIFLSSTKIEDISAGLVKLKLPYRGAFAFSTAIRLVPMIVATSYTIVQAQKSRGLDVESGNFVKRMKKYLPLMVPTFVSVMRGSNIFSMALESKGFGYSNERTSFTELKMIRNDYLLIIFSVLLFVLFLFLKINYNL